MVSFHAAAALLAATSAMPTCIGFTTWSSSFPAVPSATRSKAVRPLHATEAFQRSLLEAQLSYSHDFAPSIDEHVSSASSDNEDHLQITTDSSAVTLADNIASIQNSILRIAASTDRGQNAKTSQKERVSNLIASLESNAPKHDSEEGSSTTIPSYLVGTWELLYSNTQLFRSSPFFLAGRSTCKTPEQAAQYNWFCNMHRAALAISTIGDVRQVITKDGRLVNEFEVRAGAIPFLSYFVPSLRYSGGLPFTIDGAIVSSADIMPKTTMEWELYMDTVEIKGSNIPILRNLLDSENVALKSRDLSQLLEENVDSYQVPKPVLRTTYVDSDMRIVRDEDDNIFLYSKVSSSEEPTDYSGVLADFGVASLLEGFNDAITKIYL
ncbi:hypothetical protein ACHAWU_004963 [Discostella pseudostelligera]|uniref:Plastid lipid-associated protein/fibrillin conserved domain-containing protein n=1 Tax=Discostella pseudostelligera TaxID=259834 RepID=A0ABD3NBI0_9STRA